MAIKRHTRSLIEVYSVTEAVEARDKDVEEEDDDEDDRGSWGNQCEFILSCLGFAVGFGNVWRFPYLCYKNGGAVFLIPYIVMLFCAGLPMFFLELALGQYVGLGPTALFPKLAPMFSGLGIAMPVIAYFVSVYFDVIIAWSFYYIFSSFTSELPWGNCDNDFNTPKCASDDDISSCDTNATTPFYYDTVCYNITGICQIAGLQPENNTSLNCLLANSNDTIKAGLAVGRMSSAEEFYRNGVLGVKDATWEDFGGIQWKLFGFLALGWVLALCGLIKGVKTTGKAVYFTSLFPYVVLTILLCFGLTLEGSYEGIQYYFLKVDVSKLRDATVWKDAASQLFFSLGTSFGSLVTLASYNKFTTNCMRDAMIISVCNCATSVYAGFGIFAILGSLAHKLKVPIEDIITSGSGLAFIAYPQAVLTMPPPQLWSVLFFCMFLSIGLSSQFAMVETVNTSIYDKWPALREKKHYVASAVCFSMFCCGIPMVFQGGVFLFEIYNSYSAGLSVILIAISECLLVNYVYGHSKFMSHITDEMGIHVPTPLAWYWKIMWMVVTPGSLIFIFVMSIVYMTPTAWGDYVLPGSAQAVGWVLFSASIGFIPLVAVITIFKGTYKGMDMVRPTPMMCPAKERRRLKKIADPILAFDNKTFVPDIKVEDTEMKTTPK